MKLAKWTSSEAENDGYASVVTGDLLNYGKSR